MINCLADLQSVGNIQTYQVLNSNAKNSSEILFIQIYLHDFHVIGEFISLYYDQKGFKK